AAATPLFYTLSLHRRSSDLGDVRGYRVSLLPRLAGAVSRHQPAGVAGHYRRARPACGAGGIVVAQLSAPSRAWRSGAASHGPRRSEEHTSELQSRENLVCRL